MDREELKKIRNWPFSGGTQGEWAARSMGNAIIDAILSDPAPAQAAEDGAGEPAWRVCAHIRRRDASLFDAPIQADSDGHWCLRCPEWEYHHGEPTKRGCRAEAEEFLRLAALAAPASPAAPPTVIINPEMLATLLAGRTIETPLVRLEPHGLSTALSAKEG